MIFKQPPFALFERVTCLVQMPKGMAELVEATSPSAQWEASTSLNPNGIEYKESHA